MFIFVSLVRTRHTTDLFPQFSRGSIVRYLGSDVALLDSLVAPMSEEGFGKNERNTKTVV